MIRSRAQDGHKSFDVGARPARVRLIPFRRDYKSWVADETIEDYALRYTPPSARRFSLFAIANTAFGTTSFMALEVIGALVTLSFGTKIAVAAILSMGALLFMLGLPITFAAANRGIDIDLLTRGAGFGYLGATVTSLIYASFTFIFFALEASILAQSLHDVLGLPLAIGQVLSAVVVVPMVLLGITFISRFQRATQPVWLLLTLLPVLVVLDRAPHDVRAWLSFGGLQPARPLLAFGAAASVVVSLVAQIGEQVDYLRFLPERTRANRVAWWAALLLSGPGWIIPGIIKLLIGSLLAVVALRAGLAGADRPSVMYGHAFGLLLPRGAAGMLALLLIVVAQLKINVTNAYSGSIAWSNFFARLTRNYPGRAVWVVFNVAIALALVLLGVYPVIAHVLVCFSILACGWIGALFADLAIARPLGLVPPVLDHKRAHLFDINPVGVGAMTASAAGGLLSLAGLFGHALQSFAPFVALALSTATVPGLAVLTGGRTYIARRARRGWRDAVPACSLCGKQYEPYDTSYCPAYRGAICSLCCTLEVRCKDACRPHARAGAGMERVLARFGSRLGIDEVGRAVVRFALRMVVALALLAVLLITIWLAASGGDAVRDERLHAALEHAFVALAIVAGIIVWGLTLAEASRAAAIEENRRQTLLLEEEIARRVRTDAMLTRARQVAESANLAKSRFVVGVAHELRTPLNAVLGYAQLLELDASIPPSRLDWVRAIRIGGEHLARLIEGLLDISKIEAGRVQMERRQVRLDDFLGQIADMFRMQAQARGVGFHFDASANLARTVAIDETRLRQVLINLLSNAVKFTEHGAVSFTVAKRGLITEFAVADTGRGIRSGDLERIFEPFERAGAPNIQGIGLGLTITRLLVQMMGGEITVESEPGRGSVFRVRMLLTAVSGNDVRPAERRTVRGYRGPRRTLAAADDDAQQRALLEEALVPLGFILHAVPDGAGLLRLAAEARDVGRGVDAFLLDISMHGGDGALDGWSVARRLRASGETAPIIIVSAHPEDVGAGHVHDAFLAKPMNIQRLRETLGELLGLEWSLEEPVETTQTTALRDALPTLREMSRIGHVRGLQTEIASLAARAPGDPTIAALDAAARGYRLDVIDTLLDGLLT